MPILQVIVLAFVQGLTEFLPISSTAHLFPTSRLLGWEAESLSFDIILHLGTLIAVLLYFFRDWLQIIGQGFGMRVGHDQELKHNRGLLWLLAIGSIPVGIAGLVFNKQAESTVAQRVRDRRDADRDRNCDVVCRERRRASCATSATINLPDAVAIGLAQALAVVPGCSRSGVTISAGLFRNLTRESAARFSFLLSTPAIGGRGAESHLRIAQRAQAARAAERRSSWSASRSARSPGAP